MSCDSSSRIRYCSIVNTVVSSQDSVIRRLRFAELTRWHIPQFARMIPTSDKLISKSNLEGTERPTKARKKLY